jgi:hypothetical protein
MLFTLESSGSMHGDRSAIAADRLIEAAVVGEVRKPPRTVGRYLLRNMNQATFREA